MNENQDWYVEHIRRKALAEIRISKEISKQDMQFPPKTSTSSNPDEPSPNQIHNRFQHANDLSKPSFGMMFLSIMLTLTSIVLVTSCFVTTVDSYDIAMNQTEGININGNGGGILMNRFYPAPPRITAYHFQKPRFNHFYFRNTLHG